MAIATIDVTGAERVAGEIRRPSAAGLLPSMRTSLIEAPFSAWSSTACAPS